jgi:hypothetical protein
MAAAGLNERQRRRVVVRELAYHERWIKQHWPTARGFARGGFPYPSPEPRQTPAHLAETNQILRKRAEWLKNERPLMPKLVTGEGKKIRRRVSPVDRRVWL